MFLAACGIDVWRIQLHGRWGSGVVLRYVRLSPLAGSLALEASLGRDLKSVQGSILAAKAELARTGIQSLGKTSVALQAVCDKALGEDLASPAGALGIPEVSQVLGAKGPWRRDPALGEVLLENKDSLCQHSAKPPIVITSWWPDGELADIEAEGGTTWCGWTWTRKCNVKQWTVDSSAENLCTQCFGRKEAAAGSASESGESSSSD